MQTTANRVLRYVFLSGAVFVLSLLSTNAWADTIFWTDWTSFTAGNTNGSAVGFITLPGPNTVNVSYSGQVLGNSNINNTAGGISWGPATTFSGGSVSNAPPFRDIITLTGGTATGINTITFSSSVVDPVMALWSVGAPGVAATFVFGDEPFDIQSGGPSNEFAGSSITKLAGNIVSGTEGNGTVRFTGTFTKIDWTNPQFENFYGFTVGIVGIGSAGPAPVPEPSTYVMLVTGMLLLAPVIVGRARRNCEKQV